MPYRVTHKAKYHGKRAGWGAVEEETVPTAKQAEELAAEFGSHAVACDDARFGGDGTPIDTIIEIEWIEESK